MLAKEPTKKLLINLTDWSVIFISKCCLYHSRDNGHDLSNYIYNENSNPGDNNTLIITKGRKK